LAFAQATGAKATTLNVVSPPGLVFDEAMTSGLVKKLEKSFKEVAVERAEKMLARLVEDAKAKGVPCENMVVVGRQPLSRDHRHCRQTPMRPHHDGISRAPGPGRPGVGQRNSRFAHCSIPILVLR
jgi:hypothetical protein